MRSVELIRIRKKNCDLLPAHARHGIALTDALGDRLSNLAKHMISDGMTESIINVLEVVDIEEQE